MYSLRSTRASYILMCGLSSSLFSNYRGSCEKSARRICHCGRCKPHGKKRVWLEIMIEVDPLHTGGVEIVPQRSGQLFSDGFIRHTFPQPSLVMEHEPGPGCGANREMLPRFRPSILGAFPHEGQQRSVGDRHGFLPAAHLAAANTIQPGEIDGQQPGGLAAAEYRERVDIGYDFCPPILQGFQSLTNDKEPLRGLSAPADRPKTDAAFPGGGNHHGSFTRHCPCPPLQNI